MNALVPVLRSRGFLNRPSNDLFHRFFDDVDRFFDDRPSLWGRQEVWAPTLDVSENEDAIVVKAELPGMSKDDINITFSDGLLTLSGEKKEETRDEKENVHLRETHYGAFQRTIRIPVAVDHEKIDATYKDGVLRLTVPKSDAAKPRKIQIHG
jgi:HSP20 family protein